MSALSRYTQKIFGSTAGSNQIAEFGSLYATTPATYSGATITPTIVQALSNYLTGWFGAVIGANSPAIEDMNALFFLITYQLASIFQDGISRYDAGTTYYVGSLVNLGGVTYRCINDNSGMGVTGQAPTNATYWAPPGGNAITIIANYTVLPTDDMILVGSNTLHGSGFTITLPSCSAVPIGKTYWIKNAIASTSYQNLVGASGSDEIDGSSGYDIPATSSAYVVVKSFSNATNGIWLIVGSGT